MHHATQLQMEASNMRDEVATLRHLKNDADARFKDQVEVMKEKAQTEQMTGAIDAASEAPLWPTLRLSPKLPTLCCVLRTAL